MRNPNDPAVTERVLGHLYQENEEDVSQGVDHLL